MNRIKDNIEKQSQYYEKNKYICTCSCGSNVQKINMTKHMETKNIDYSLIHWIRTQLPQQILVVIQANELVL